MKPYAILLLAALALLPAACSAPRQVTIRPDMFVDAAHVPNGLIYKTTGDYRDRVPVTVDPATGNLTSYPDPADIRASVLPVQLPDGWLLDTRGISANTRFTTYTYKEYAALAVPPTPAQLKAAIIPDARVTQIRELPWKNPVWQQDHVIDRRVIENAKPLYTAPH